MESTVVCSKSVLNSTEGWQLFLTVNNGNKNDGGDDLSEYMYICCMYVCMHVCT